MSILLKPSKKLGNYEYNTNKPPKVERFLRDLHLSAKGWKICIWNNQMIEHTNLPSTEINEYCPRTRQMSIASDYKRVSYVTSIVLRWNSSTQCGGIWKREGYEQGWAAKGIKSCFTWLRTKLLYFIVHQTLMQC